MTPDKFIKSYRDKRDFLDGLQKARDHMASFCGICAILSFLIIGVLILFFTKSLNLIFEFFTTVIIFTTAMFGINYLSHAKNRNAIEAFEDMSSKWDSYHFLKCRGYVLYQGRHSNDKIKRDDIKNKLQSIKELVRSQREINILKKHRIEFKKINERAYKLTICDFFEELGYMLKINVIDIAFVYDMFGSDIEIYYLMLENFLKDISPDSDAYINFDDLYNICLAFKKHSTACARKKI